MQKTFMISSNFIFLEDGCYKGTLLIQDGKIKQFFPKGSQLPLGIEIINADDQYVLPGIIDIHSHGYLTWSAKTIDREEIKGLSKILPSIGVTSTLATTTAWKDHEIEMLSSIANAIEDGCEGARILGIHMEGPFYNPDRHNATPRQEVIPPSIEKMKEYWKASRGYLRYMTVAPEVKGALEVIAWLKENGVVVGAGHTDAKMIDFQKGVNAGIQSSIHTGNAMRQIDRREVGAMGAAVLDPNVYCEMICDFHHLSPEMIEIMIRVKNDMSKLIMISDSDHLSGIEPGDYYTFNKVIHVHEDGRILLDDGTISGSSRYVLYGIQNLVNGLHIPLPKVIPLFSLNPATLLGIQKIKGSLKEGKDADICILDQDFHVLYTFVEGKCCYQKGDFIVRNTKFSEICQKIENE